MAGVSLRRRIFLASIYGVIPASLLLVALVGWLVSAENATVVLQAENSPDGRYRAEVVRADPGVSSSYEYMVRVMPTDVTMLARSLHGLPFSPIYVALDLHREPDKLSVVWSDPSEVTIHCEGCGGTAPGKESWREIALRYELR
jgi:hypothetical protein